MSDGMPDKERPGDQPPPRTNGPVILIKFAQVWKHLVTWAQSVARIMKHLFTSEGKAVWLDLTSAFKHLKPKRILFGTVLLAVSLYLLSGVYTVQPGKNAVVRTLGAVSDPAVAEGLHYRLPWPFAQVAMVDVSDVRREIIGLEQAEPDHPDHPDGQEKIQVLSGDTNIIDYVAVVQYKVKDPASYLFASNATPYRMVRNAIRTAITKKSAVVLVDDILTTKRQAMQSDIRNDIQALLDSYGSGVAIVSVNFQKAYPPEDVAEAFRDVQSAKEDKEKMINQATGYQNSLLPEARGAAERAKIDARAYALAAVDSAKGASASFEKILSQYRSDRQIYGEDVTRFRLYLETAERVFKRVKTYVVDKGGKIDLRMIEELPNRGIAPPPGGQ